MDRRLFEAARSGSIEALLEVLADDPLILERVPLAQDTPLHVAVLAGKTEFAKEILRQRPRYALELNKDGFSPIHIASINGDIELVRELLKVDSSLCSLKDRDGRTPIHLASMKGRLDVMGELLSACPESAREVTVQGETILHLVGKSNQFEDKDGFSPIQIAAINGDIELTVELLLNSKSESMVEVNLKNLTAMDLVDILLQSSCDEGYFIIGRLPPGVSPPGFETD
ncbi:hypothetical protein Sjap_004606 [Stephania japonica]|uniref:Uncharacterized protein n=1 Tax=Stephania japonica TaxID=461633 RepID=A0AAP0K2J2_9MAGN